MDQGKCLVLFIRYPEKGRVKSRLASALDEDTVILLYRAFIEDMLENLSEGDYRFRIAFHPAERLSDLRQEFGAGFFYLPQTGPDLGRKMLDAFNRCFSDGCRSVIIIGSDIPDLPQQVIEEAFLALEKNDAVIGPSLDGGYYLIGFGRDSFTPAAFEGIAWGGDGVYENTVRILEMSGLRFHVLPAWRDIDRPEDITALIRECGEKGFAGSRTMAVLRDRSLMKG